MKQNGTKNVFPIVFIFFIVLLLVCYAIYLNRTYYSIYGPFYDSMSYMNHLGAIVSTARNEGVIKAIQLGAHGNTVFFPWLIGALIGGIVNLNRDIAVIIQVPLVLTQAISGYFYFKKVSGYSTIVSVAFSIVLITFGAMFYYNGGLSDLRMDLSQGLAFGSALALFSIAHKCRETKYWVIFGLMLGISFLVRATTPVYAVLVFGTCALVDAFISRGNIKVWLNPYLISAGLAMLISLWFYIVNFNFLYYYYFIWNYDANASLPLAQSIGHLNFLFSMHLGMPICMLLVLVFLSQIYKRFLYTKINSLDLNWTMLLGAIIPVGFLVFFGAALNPFVSMVSVPGLIMFSLAPFKSNALSTQTRGQVIFYVCSVFVAIVITAFSGIESHKKIASPWIPNIAGVQAITNIIIKDMEIQKKKSGAFEVTYVGSVDSTTIMNSLIYDQKFTFSVNKHAEKNGLIMEELHPGLANPVEWAAIHGSQPSDKLKTLVDEAVAKADYLIMPENNTTFVPHYPISPYAFELRDLIVKSKSFTKISEPIELSSLESISIYRSISK